MEAVGEVSAQDHPEPVEPPMTSVPGGIYCLVHGVMDCAEPWCYRCGNHEMDAFERCADPRCHASNGPIARKVIEDLHRRFDGPIPIEVAIAAIAAAYAEEPSARR